MIALSLSFEKVIKLYAILISFSFFQFENLAKNEYLKSDISDTIYRLYSHYLHYSTSKIGIRSLNQ